MPSSESEIAERRMTSLGLRGRGFAAPEDVVRWLVAVQSQELGGARWALGQRTRRATADDVERSYAEGRLVRTHVLRPTWHFVLPEDIRWLLDLTSARLRARMAPYLRAVGLDDDACLTANRVIARAVESGHRTRDELRGALERTGFDVSNERVPFLVMRAEFDGVICSGVPRGAQQTYASLDERAPDGRGRDHDEALADLALRYVTSRGPVAAQDMAWWSGLTVSECRRGLHAAAAQLEREDVDGATYWSAGPARRRSPARRPIVDLVHTYDERVVSYGRTRDVPFSSRSEPFSSAVLLDGLRIGTWRLRRGGRDTLDVAVGRSLDDAGAAALEREIRRLERFLGTELRVRMSTA